ncbi:MAG: CvpA family protein [Myxococcales bacterium]|nr:CvpA family protein [Myxococcales bacterium]MDH5305862.1 CvpA family protein [Myxococcales bacterium]MDH5566439.1 CvpA family protein [Myxococcales bacterium]
MRSVDLVVAAILGIALLRGLVLGLIREAFSIGALAGACVVVRLFTSPTADWLVQATAGTIGARTAPWLAGGALAIATVAGVALVGRLLQRGARAAGLGWADRAGGAVLGTAEGMLVASLLLLVLTAAIGRGHPLVAGSKSIAALEQLERLAAERPARPIDVAAPPPKQR